MQGASSPLLRSRRAKEIGRDAGFDLVRVAHAGEMHQERDRYLRWIAEGRHAEMQWITAERAQRATSPGSVAPGTRSVISVAMAYRHGMASAGPGSGRIARYAWGADYHQVLGVRLTAMLEELKSEFGGDHSWYVDTGPMMDKALAARSGLGWYGKNTNILTEQFGSFVLLGEILTSLELEPDKPLTRDCGSCSLCTIACPTGALGPDYSIDSRKCISYLTIEHRGPIPRELRSLMGAWVFGCDICQDVCPPSSIPYLKTAEERRQWAQDVRGYLTGSGRANGAERPHGHEERGQDLVVGPLFGEGVRPAVDLCWLLKLTQEQYLEAFRGSSIRRAKVWMLRRNAAIALGNTGGAGALAPLIDSMRGDEHPIVRGHAAWAAGRIVGRLHLDAAGQSLRQALECESDGSVREEINEALKSLEAQAIA
ncbi:MAG: tRNA epoxyqueuosine(34) reductase QueG [Chloroflexota bacterium]